LIETNKPRPSKTDIKLYFYKLQLWAVYLYLRINWTLVNCNNHIFYNELRRASNFLYQLFPIKVLFVVYTTADRSNVLETRSPLHSSEVTRNPAKIATPWHVGGAYDTSTRSLLAFRSKAIATSILCEKWTPARTVKVTYYGKSWSKPDRIR